MTTSANSGYMASSFGYGQMTFDNFIYPETSI